MATYGLHNEIPASLKERGFCYKVFSSVQQPTEVSALRSRSLYQSVGGCLISPYPRLESGDFGSNPQRMPVRSTGEGAVVLVVAADEVQGDLEDLAHVGGSLEVHVSREGVQVLLELGDLPFGG